MAARPADYAPDDQSEREIAYAKLLKELEIAFHEADAGRFVEWDPEVIKREGRRRMNEESTR